MFDCDWLGWFCTTELSRGRQQDRRSIGDDQRVLIVSGKPAVGRLHSPPITCNHRARRTHRNNRLDRQHQAGG